MILLLDTGGTVCRLVLVDKNHHRHESEWEANRELAKGLLSYIESELHERQLSFSDISAIGVFRGPGSFTGLRIGITVLDTLADALGVPIVGEIGNDWQNKALKRLEKGESDQIVLPLYGSEAHVTQPRK